MVKVSEIYGIERGIKDGWLGRRRIADQSLKSAGEVTMRHLVPHL
jgi:hypothetical protein